MSRILLTSFMRDMYTTKRRCCSRVSAIVLIRIHLGGLGTYLTAVTVVLCRSPATSSNSHRSNPACGIAPRQECSTPNFTLSF
ncbi:hypothetical protein KC325_g114 [Hortaea werneckii]|nr:hypothetical protein KC325_g114 [Hortaea werneckii]